jgi:hypothetical protein
LIVTTLKKVTQFYNPTEKTRRVLTAAILVAATAAVGKIVSGI